MPQPGTFVNCIQVPCASNHIWTGSWPLLMRWKAKDKNGGQGAIVSDTEKKVPSLEEIELRIRNLFETGRRRRRCARRLARRREGTVGITSGGPRWSIGETRGCILMFGEPDSWMNVLRFTALLSRRQRTGMPLFIVGVRIAEPPTASRTANRGGMRAWLVVTRYGLTEMLQVRA